MHPGKYPGREAARLRRHLLDDVVFHGWPDQWVKLLPRFEDAGVIEGGEGYKIRKLRYEIVPGFQSVALLYEPENLSGKVPAILNVNGHVGPPGKSVEYKQKRCINFAKHCECCGDIPTGKLGLHLDHDHETGRFRGWCCSGCNTGLGLADSPTLLRKRLRYLRRAEKDDSPIKWAYPKPPRTT